MKQSVIAIIGCGRIANLAHAPALSGMENVRIKYACDIILSKAEALKEKFPKVEQTVEDYRVVLADPEVEAVWVLTPNYAHYTVAMDALRAGKHVFCEKPITVNYALSCEMAEEAKRQGKMLNIGVCNRYQASVAKLAEMVKNGEFGKVYHVVCSFRSQRSIPGLGGAFTTKSQSGGGVLIDWGIHFLDLILYILGDAKVQSVTADSYCEMAKDMKAYRHHGMWAEDTADIENGTNDVEDFISGYIRTDKAGITFTGAWAQNLAQNEMYVDILGDKGGCRLDYCGQFTFFNGETLESYTTSHELPDFYTLEDSAFLTEIETGVIDRNNIVNILESAKLLDILYKSADVRRELEC